MSYGLFLHFCCALLAVVGLHGMIFRPNLMRKLMGLNILQTSVILFYLLVGAKTGGQPPVGAGGLPAAADFVNPLPHALMLTAIVVGVSTSGVALALILRIHRAYGTLVETEILEKAEPR